VINFRYHIVSLMAVFLALAVGIAVGVTLSPSVQRGIATQAEQDRQQVIQLRTELDRRDSLDTYRSTYDQRTAQLVLAGRLTDERVALVAMPDAPRAVVTAVGDAVTQAGGRVVDQVRVSESVFDPTQADTVDKAVANLSMVGITDDMTPATRVGWYLSRAIASKNAAGRDEYAKTVGRTLAAAGLVDVRDDVDDTAQLVVVITAPTSSWTCAAGTSSSTWGSGTGPAALTTSPSSSPDPTATVWAARTSKRSGRRRRRRGTSAPWTSPTCRAVWSRRSSPARSSSSGSRGTTVRWPGPTTRCPWCAEPWSPPWSGDSRPPRPPPRRGWWAERSRPARPQRPGPHAGAGRTTPASR
jgi:hypothetical protein